MSSRLIILGRVILLLIAAGAVVAAFVITRREDRAAREPGGRYVCPMHPEVTSSVPGDTCPICRMDLELVAPASGSTNAPSAAYSPLNAQYFDVPKRRSYGQDVRAPAWVEADGAVAAILYEDELATLGLEEHVTFSPASPAGAPGERIEIHLEPEAPIPWDRATSQVHFRVDVPDTTRPGDVGWVTLSGKRRELVSIPSSTLLEDAEGPYVLVAEPGWILTRRRVEVGRVFGGLAFVISGLSQHDRVLVRDTFFHDAERRLREATP
jgi:Heavy metal binding domain